MQAIPPRPDVSVVGPPPKRSIPLGAVIMALAGLAGMASAAFPWWSASASLAFSNGPGGEVTLGVFRGAAAPIGRAAAIAGLVSLTCGMSALGTTSARLRRMLGSGGVAAGLVVSLAGGWSVPTGDDAVASRADASVYAQDLGISTTASGFASELGREAGLSDPVVSFDGRPAAGVVLAIVAGITGILGGWLLRREPGGDQTPGGNGAPVD